MDYEITDKMVEAGVDAMLSRTSEAGNEEFVVQRVFKAMYDAMLNDKVAIPPETFATAEGG